MIRNYLKIAFRNLVRYKIYTAINLIGLSIGLASVIMLLTYIFHELSFDTYHDDYQKIYRVVSKNKSGNSVSKYPTTVYEIASEVKKAFPNVDNAGKFFEFNPFYQISKDEDEKVVASGVYADNSIINTLSVMNNQGNKEDLLNEKYTVILSESVKQKLFRDKPAINQFIKIFKTDYKITGVYPDFPKNSHIRPEILIAIESAPKGLMQSNAVDFPTYIKFNNKPDDIELERIANYIAEFVNTNYNHVNVDIELQRIDKIHLKSDFSSDYANLGNRFYILIFSLVTLFIFIVAILNYLNIMTSQFEKRYREVGIRKVLGSLKRQIIFQFISESVMLTFIAFLLGMLLVETFIQDFSNLVSQPIDVSYIRQSPLLFVYFALAVVVGVFSAWYPAFYISRFNPVSLFQQIDFAGKRKDHLRRLLVIFQFSITIILLVSLYVFNTQIDYMKNKNLGFNRKSVVNFFSLSSKINDSYDAVKNQLLQNPEIKDVTASMSIPGSDRSPMSLRLPSQDESEAFDTHENRVQPGFINTYQIPMIGGHDFTKPHTEMGIIINETAVKKLGLKNPIGKEVYLWIHKCNIIGVMKDYHFASMKNRIEPLVLSTYLDLKFCLGIRIDENHTQNSIDFIINTLQDFDSEYQPNYIFMDDYFKKMYRTEENILTMIKIASVLAVVLSIIGLYALLSLTINKKIKFIAINKVFGATWKNIFFLLYKQILGWLLIAILIGWVVSYFMIQEWLVNFPYKISLNFTMFLMPALAGSFLAMISILFQIKKTSALNPVLALKYE
ncbi:MAG TPA: FtsX-like permease family protein [Bacteroidales bacterium]|nr:FtsX-like permease family protein [Bacteroidales bacterium]